VQTIDAIHIDRGTTASNYDSKGLFRARRVRVVDPPGFSISDRLRRSLSDDNRRSGVFVYAFCVELVNSGCQGAIIGPPGSQ